MSIRLGGKLKELRIHLCQTSKSSQGVREWLESNYVNLKRDNPNFPILVRECSGIQPRIWARYEKCKEKYEELANKTPEQISSILDTLNKSEKGVETSAALTDKSGADVTATIKKLIK